MSDTKKLTEHPLFARIQEEHEACRRQIEAAKSIVQKKSLLLWLRAADEDHHRREEIHLFTRLLGKPRLREGGPYCVFYFDEHICNPPRDLALKITGSPPLWLPEQEIFHQNTSPLDIPVEEHRTLRALLDYLISEQEKMSDSAFQTIFQTYVDVLLRHMTKEERCFFKLCQQVLEEKELDEIWQDWSLPFPQTSSDTSGAGAPPDGHC